MADAEDEFQVVNTIESWVHIQISGISRGWIRGDAVDIPAASTRPLATSYSGLDHADKPAFRETREEVSLFPGKWEPLSGKKVKIIWIQPYDGNKSASDPRWSLVKSVFRKAYAEASKNEPAVAVVVVVFDSADGDMAAATMATLQQWRAGHLLDAALWKHCWLDPADAFKVKD